MAALEAVVVTPVSSLRPGLNPTLTASPTFIPTPVNAAEVRAAFKLPPLVIYFCAPEKAIAAGMPIPVAARAAAAKSPMIPKVGSGRAIKAARGST